MGRKSGKQKNNATNLKIGKELVLLSELVECSYKLEKKGLPQI